MNIVKALWQGEKKAIVTGAVLFVIWLVFIGQRKYGWKGGGRYGR